MQPTVLPVNISKSEAKFDTEYTNENVISYPTIDTYELLSTFLNRHVRAFFELVKICWKKNIF